LGFAFDCAGHQKTPHARFGIVSVNSPKIFVHDGVARHPGGKMIQAQRIHVNSGMDKPALAKNIGRFAQDNRFVGPHRTRYDQPRFRQASFFAVSFLDLESLSLDPESLDPESFAESPLPSESDLDEDAPEDFFA